MQPTRNTRFFDLRAYLVGAVGLLVGLLLGLYLPRWKLLLFENKVSFGELLSSVTAVIVAFILGLVLDKHSKDARGEKDLLLRRTDSLMLQFSDLEGKLGGASFYYIEAAAAIKRMRMSLASLKKCLKNHGYDGAVEKCDAADALLDRLRDETTGGLGDAQKPGKSRGIKIKDGQVPADFQLRQLLEGTFSQSRDALLDIQLAVNGA